MGNGRWRFRSGHYLCSVLMAASLDPGRRRETDRPRAGPTRRDPCAISGESRIFMLGMNMTYFSPKASVPLATGSFNSSYGAVRRPEHWLRSWDLERYSPTSGPVCCGFEET